jgi:hypothetical protein
MRFIVGGIVLLAMAAATLGQARDAEGEVESIGFDGHYRPNCWVPMKLVLRPKIGAAAQYRIAIIQEDIDRDRVHYTQSITLTGNPEGRQIEERVWVYFRPQPRGFRGFGTADQLNNVVRVFLCTAEGRQLLQIPFSPRLRAPVDLDDPGSAFSGRRGTRLVLVVGDAGIVPMHAYDRAHGINEDVLFVPVQPRDLPDHVLGYEAVDHIVWTSSNPLQIESGTMAAIEQYVRNGGRLLACTGANWQQVRDSDLARMLPVELTGIEDEVGARSLRMLAGVPDPQVLEELPKAGEPRYFNRLLGRTVDPWPDLAKRAAPVVRARARREALVVQHSALDRASPYLARWLYGLGTVSWVGQDLTDRSLRDGGSMRHMGWDRIWDRALDLPHDTVTFDDATVDRADAARRYRDVYGDAEIAVDLSWAMLSGMELPQRGAALVALAVVFFIAYWLIAGPGSYFFLLARRLAQYSWVAFGVAALAATALTVLVVRLVLRGPPQIQHVSLVRMAPDGTTWATSQFGLFIPRDGPQDLSLRDTPGGAGGFIVPYPMHPSHLRDVAQFLAPLEYEVQRRGRGAIEPVRTTVPFRSTLKKFQTRWIGTTETGISGSLTLHDNYLGGRLTNNTDIDFQQFWMAYAARPDTNQDVVGDWLIYVEGGTTAAAWPRGGVIDFATLKLNANLRQRRPPEDAGDRAPLGEAGWMERWRLDFTSRYDSSYSNRDRAAVLMSLFDRIKPVRSDQAARGSVSGRFELLRRAGRHWDVSPALSAGHAVVLARSRTDKAPLPFGLEVQRQQIAGEGVVYYQFIVPIERSGAARQSRYEEGWLEEVAEANRLKQAREVPGAVEAVREDAGRGAAAPR